MQATTFTHRFEPRQIKQAALAIAILTSTAIGVTTATIVRDAANNSTGRAAVVDSADANREQTFGYQYMEQNLDLPTAGAAHAVNRFSDYVFMEQNLNLPGSDIAPATGADMDYRFREMNLELPDAVSSVAPNWRVVEENSWGENFVLDAPAGASNPPSAGDVPQQLTGEVAY